MKSAALILVCAACFAREDEAIGVPAPEMTRIEGGTYVPMFGERDKPRIVGPFLLDRHPVTNGDFLAFVREHPKWRRSQVRKLFADAGYLSHWQGDLDPGPLAPVDAPVVRVSWFAARAYLKSVGKRLPREDEWEFAARADTTRADATTDPDFLRRILEWYGKPTPETLPAADSMPADIHGVSGLHGLVWEWVEDFNNQMVTGAARNDTSLDRSLFCAGGAANATDASNYAAFMRYAFRSSLEGAFTVTNLGFRGTRDLPQPNSEKP